MLRRNRRNSEAGFTLLELIVVCVILVVMAGILYGTINGILRGRNAILAQGSTYRVSRYVLGRLNRELSSRAPEKLSATATETGAEGAALAASAPGQQRYIISENKTENDQQLDSLRFASDGVAQAFLAATGNQGRVQLYYHLEKDPDRKQEGDKTVYTLVREELPAASNDAEFLQLHRVVFPVAENVLGFNVRFLKAGKWLDEWTSTSVGFPEAMELTLTLQGDNNEVETFRTAVAISRKFKLFTSIGGGSGT